MKYYLPLRITGLFFSVALLLFSACQYPSQSASDLQAVSLSASPIPAPPIQSPAHEMYGIETQGYEIVQAEVKRNEVLGELLAENGVDYPTIASMVEASKGIFDIRRLRPGRLYTLLKKDDGKVDYFIYEKNRREYVVWKLANQVEAYAARKPVTTEEREASGVITSSLYATIDKQNLNLELASRLEDIYAWSLDFFHTQKGDWFKVVYDEVYVDGESIGVGEIKSAVFKHGDQSFYAIGFEKEVENVKV